MSQKDLLLSSVQQECKTCVTPDPFVVVAKDRILLSRTLGDENMQKSLLGVALHWCPPPSSKKIKQKNLQKTGEGYRRGAV